MSKRSSHLARIDGLRGDSAGVDTWLRRAREYASDDLVGRLSLHVRTFGGVPSMGGVDRQRLQRASTLHGGPGARDILADTDPEDTERFAAQFLTADVPNDLAAYGHRLAAYASGARGQFNEALRHLDEAQESDVDSDVEVRSLIVATPGSPVDSATLRRRGWRSSAGKPTYSHDPDQSLDAIAHSRVALAASPSPARTRRAPMPATRWPSSTRLHDLAQDRRAGFGHGTHRARRWR